MAEITPELLNYLRSESSGHPTWTYTGVCVSDLIAEIDRLTTERDQARAQLDEARRDAGAQVERLLNVARGCHDYGGGYREDREALEIYHYGIRTVIDALEAARKGDPKDTQVNTLERIGRAAQPAAISNIKHAGGQQ